jgi:hypothetical protein
VIKQLSAGLLCLAGSLSLPLAARAQAPSSVSLSANSDGPVEQGIKWVPYEGDGNVVIGPYGDRYAFQTDPTNNQHEVYADVDDSFIKDAQPPVPVWVTVEYVNSGVDAWALQYDSGADQPFKTAAVIQKTDTGDTRTVVIPIPDASFGNREQGVADLRVDDRGDGADMVLSIAVSKSAPTLTDFGTISGTVTEAAGGQGVAGAVVRTDNGLSVTTGPDGEYSLYVQNGSYNLQVVRPGYLKQDPQSADVTSGGTTTVDWSLQPYGKDAVSLSAQDGQPVEDGLHWVFVQGDTDGFGQVETQNDVDTLRTGPDTDPFPDSFLYANVDDDYLFQGQPSQEVWITMEYLDQGTAPFGLDYDSADNMWAGGAKGVRTNTGTWKSYTWHLKDAYFGDREQSVADFRISDGGGGDDNDLYIRSVTVSVKPPANFGTLTGVVTNASTAGTIADATVTADTGESVMTGADGKFSIQLPEGSHTLTVIGFGFSSVTVPNVTVTAGQTTTAPTIALNPTVVRTSVSFGVQDGQAAENGIKWVQNGEDTDGYGTFQNQNGRESLESGPSADPYPDRFLYMDVDDTFLFNGKPTREVWVTMDYFDAGVTPFRLDYDAESGAFKSAETVDRTDSQTWKSYTWHLTDANFANREQNTADFRLWDGDDNGDTDDLFVSGITVSTKDPNPSALKGDVNGDGSVNVQDATLALRIAVSLLTPTDAQKAAADVNGDGSINVQDATIILRKAVGLPTDF